MDTSYRQSHTQLALHCYRTSVFCIVMGCACQLIIKENDNDDDDDKSDKLLSHFSASV